MSKQPVLKTTPPISDEQLEALRVLIPQAFSEGKIDLEKLRLTLGDLADDRPERYSFSWAGKRDAIRLLQVPSRATLTPARDESLDFDTTQNLFIEGDNLEVLKLLYKPYFGRVKMIYIDPPYNTGNDFVYPDNFADPLDTYLKLTGQKDSEGNLLTSNPETGGRYHSAWLSMMYPRLFLARQLLREDGVIFVSIDDHEVHNLRLLMNEAFGEENFVATIIWQKMDSPSRNDADRALSDYHDYILVFARNKYESGLYQMSKKEILEAYPLKLPDGRLARRRQLRKNGKGARREDRPTMWFPLTAPDGSNVYPIAPEGWEGRWVLSEETWRDRGKAGLTEWIKRDTGWMPYYIEIAPEEPSIPWPTIWTDVDQNRQAKAEFTDIMGSGINFENPKPSNLIKNILHMATSHEDICLDFFAGSCTTAQAVLELNREDGGNRRFIMVQLPEPTDNQQFPTIAEIGKERIRRVVARMKKDRDGQLALDKPEDLGFKVFKLAPSNYKQWQGDPQGLQDPVGLVKQAELFADPLLEGWQPENVLYEVALKEGYGLNVMVETMAVKDVQRVSDPDKDQSFYLTLSKKIALKELRPLDLKKDDLFICRDSALDDKTAANLALQCRLKTI